MTVQLSSERPPAGQINPLWGLVYKLFPEDVRQFAQIGDYIVGLATIKPATASGILDKHNLHNREPNPWAVRRLAKDIGRDAFLLNGDTIVFDDCGMARNGRHRLTACVQAGLPIRSFVVIGVAGQVFKTFDQHTKRTTAQVLQIEGETSTKLLASAISFLHGFLLLGRIAKPHVHCLITIDDDLQLLAWHPELRASVALISKVLPAQPSRKCGGQGLACAAHYVFSRVDRDMADQLFESIGTLTVPLGKQYDPVRRLIQILMDNAAKGYLFTQEKLSGLLVKGWNAYAAGASPRQVSYKDDEPYPMVFGWEYGEDLLPSIVAKGDR